MNRKDWEAQVLASDMNLTAKGIAWVVGTFGNWTEDRTVWPSVKAIADLAGTNRSTAAKYLDAMVEQGLLEVVKVRKNNVKEYRLMPLVAQPVGILARSKRATSDARLSNLSTARLPTGTAQVAEAVGTNILEPTKEPTIKNQEDVQQLPPVLDSAKRSPATPVSKADDSADAPSSVDGIQADINEWEDFFKQHPELEKPA